MKRYTVKNVKDFNGRQGVGYSCDLYCNGELIARVCDYADGSALSTWWQNPKEQETHKENIRIQMKRRDFETAMIYLVS